MWGPYQIDPELYRRAIVRARLLQSGVIGYNSIDRPYRPKASDCIHALSGVDVDPGLLRTRSAHGDIASYIVLQHLCRWLIHPEVVHDWLLGPLGFNQYCIWRRSLANRPPALLPILPPYYDPDSQRTADLSGVEARRARRWRRRHGRRRLCSIWSPWPQKSLNPEVVFIAKENRHDRALALILVSALGQAGGSTTQPPAGSFLYQPAYTLEDDLYRPAEPYQAQAGDIFMCTDRLWFWKITFNMAWTGHPHHSGIVFAQPDGKLAILEAGPHDTTYIEANEWCPHLGTYEPEGPVWVRRRRSPLTPEQSAALTDFAERQVGKRFAWVRLAGQLTPLRSRGPLRTRFMGGPHGERDSYFCCELLMESLVAAGLVDPATARPSATYPKDVFFDRSYNLYINRHLNLSRDWYPPARWTSQPIELLAEQSQVSAGAPQPWQQVHALPPPHAVQAERSRP
jgi:hypothetical protein